MSKRDIKSFYNNEGWRNIDGISKDAILNENLTLVAADYVRKVRLRILENLGSGENLLDIGCGPIQYPEYLEYSKNFRTRVCVDLSEEALRMAKVKIGEHGRYIVGDYLTLPPLDQAPFAGAVLVNVLYHVDKSNQAKLVRKVIDDLSPGAKLVIIYSNPRTLSACLTQFAVRLKHLIHRILKNTASDSLENPIYFYRYPLNFWKQFENEAIIKKFAWRTFSPALEKILFRDNLFGKFSFRFFFWVEKFSFWVHFSEYSLITLEKTA
jgi:SAM-dependent methyltransferase